MKARRDDGTEFRGQLTTEHPASSYHQPVFVFADSSEFDNGDGYGWADLAHRSIVEMVPESEAEATSLQSFLRPMGFR